MNIEELLREAIADHVADVPEPPDRWAQVEQRGALLRRRTRVRTAGLGMLGLVAATVAALLVIPRLGHETQRRVVTSPTPTTAAPPIPATTAVAPTTTVPQPASARWVPLPKAPIVGRIGAGTVWTGTDLLIFGGYGRSGTPSELADGAAYRPSTRSWRRLPPPPAGVLGVVGTGSAWTGKVAVFWAGNSPDGPATGAVYDPAADSWRKLPDGPLRPREGYASVWTGTELLIIGGAGGDAFAQPTAAAIDPATSTWRQLHGFDSLHGLAAGRAVWTGREALLAGSLSLCPEKGSMCQDSRPIFVAYDPVHDTVREIDLGRAPMTDAEKAQPKAVAWTGTRVLLSSGEQPHLFTYDPSSGTWAKASAAPCRIADPYYTTSTWAGDRFVAACGTDALQTYNPATDRWQKLAAGPSPMNTRSRATIAWTGRELLAWSGAAKEAGTPTPADGAALALR